MSCPGIKLLSQDEWGKVSRFGPTDFGLASVSNTKVSYRFGNQTVCWSGKDFNIYIDNFKIPETIALDQVWFKSKEHGTKTPYRLHKLVGKDPTAIFKQLENRSIQIKRDSTQEKIQGIIIGPKIERNGISLPATESYTVQVRIVEESEEKYLIGWFEDSQSTLSNPLIEPAEPQSPSKISRLKAGVAKKWSSLKAVSSNPRLALEDRTRWFFQSIYVDGQPLKTTTLDELKALAESVERKEMDLVILQSWSGTELLFQTPETEVPNLQEMLACRGSDTTGTETTVFFQVKIGQYTKEPFLQAYFLSGKDLVLAEKVVIGGWQEGEISPKIPQEWLTWIDDLSARGSARIRVKQSKGAPFLVIQPTDSAKARFGCIADPATAPRTIPLDTMGF